MNRLHRFDVLTAWYKEYMGINNYRPRTIEDYAFELSFFRRWLFDNTEIGDIDDLTPRALHDYAASLYNRTLAAASIQHKLCVLSSFLGTLYEANKLYIDLRGYVVLPRLPRRLPKDILSEVEIGRAFTYLEEVIGSFAVHTPDDAVVVRDYALLEALYSTGIRKGELIEVCLDDINYDDGLLAVREGKGGKDRVVPIGEKGLRAVRRYVREARPLLAAGATTQHLFLSLEHRQMNENTVLRSVKRMMRLGGVARRVHVHGMRHCCATHLLNHGADIRYVQELLGHASLSSTQIYTHVSIGKLKETHRRFHPREQPGFLSDAREEGG